MDIEWDPVKAKSNLKKHGVDFTDAVTALEDPLARTINDPDSEDEERFITLGQDALGRLLVVVYTWRARSRLRVISARKANRGERGEYEEKK